MAHAREGGELGLVLVVLVAVAAVDVDRDKDDARERAGQGVHGRGRRAADVYKTLPRAAQALPLAESKSGALQGDVETVVGQAWPANVHDTF